VPRIEIRSAAADRGDDVASSPSAPPAPPAILADTPAPIAPAAPLQPVSPPVPTAPAPAPAPAHGPASGACGSSSASGGHGDDSSPLPVALEAAYAATHPQVCVHSTSGPAGLVVGGAHDPGARPD